MTGEDPRMQITVVEESKPKPRDYRVMVRASLSDAWVEHPFTVRHEALQHYVAERKRLGDFTQKPKEFLVRIWCDGVEYFNEIARGLPGSTRNRGMSVRELTGTVRPIWFERHMP